MQRNAWPMQKLPALMIAMLLPTGCANLASKPVCPSLTPYTPEFQNKLADEIPALPTEAATAITDYGRLRDQVRACRGEKP